MNEPDEGELRVRFHDLREDRVEGPAFHALLQRAEARAVSVPRTRRLAPVWLAAAAAVVLVTGVVLSKSNDAHPSSPTTALSITQWKSPTAGLLNVSGREMFAPPSILRSPLGGAVPTPVKRQGGSR